jgi:hypothetical protein
MSESYSIYELFGIERKHHLIYVVCSAHDVKYVGLADVQAVQARIARHIGGYFDRERPTRFSTILFEHHPEYFKWKVELLTLTDVKKLTREKVGCLPCAERAVYDHYKEVYGAPAAGNGGRPGKKCTCGPAS